MMSLAALRSGHKRDVAKALTLIEIQAGTDALAGLLDEACAQPLGHVLGLTGPPGVGKSTLTNALVRQWRSKGESVAVIAIDPSSQKTGGALLGDRARITSNPNDNGLFIRSMAARDRLGGLSDQTIAAMVLMRALYDHVLIESVGIGQSEADISFAADTVLLCVQPGSGDSLQFMKAGIMELPDVIAVTKADMGPLAERAVGDVKGALSLSPSHEWQVPVLAVSATTGAGVNEILASVSAHHEFLVASKTLQVQRHEQQKAWQHDMIKTRFGTAGLDCVKNDIDAEKPFSQSLEKMRALQNKLA